VLIVPIFQELNAMGLLNTRPEGLMVRRGRALL
jgi:hypothetical protein